MHALRDTDRRARIVAEHAPAGCRAGDDVGAVSLVGQGILDDPRLLRDALAVVADQRLALHGVQTSSFRITVLVPADPSGSSGHVAALARALHDRFVTTSQPEPASS